MKIYIGNYPTTYSLYGWINHLLGGRVGDWAREHKNTWLYKTTEALVEKIQSKIAVRKVNIKIDNYDTFNMDHTLALIILPMLKQFRECKEGIPLAMFNEGAPMESYNEEHIAQARLKWDETVDKMILAFTLIVDDDIVYGDSPLVTAQRQEGLALFAKYYENLWS